MSKKFNYLSEIKQCESKIKKIDPNAIEKDENLYNEIIKIIDEISNEINKLYINGSICEFCNKKAFCFSLCHDHYNINKNTKQSIKNKINDLLKSIYNKLYCLYDENNKPNTKKFGTVAYILKYFEKFVIASNQTRNKCYNKIYKLEKEIVMYFNIANEKKEKSNTDYNNNINSVEQYLAEYENKHNFVHYKPLQQIYKEQIINHIATNKKLKKLHEFMKKKKYVKGIHIKNHNLHIKKEISVLFDTPLYEPSIIDYKIYFDTSDTFDDTNNIKKLIQQKQQIIYNYLCVKNKLSYMYKIIQVLRILINNGQIQNIKHTKMRKIDTCFNDIIYDYLIIKTTKLPEIELLRIEPDCNMFEHIGKTNYKYDIFMELLYNKTERLFACIEYNGQEHWDQNGRREIKNAARCDMTKVFYCYYNAISLLSIDHRDTKSKNEIYQKIDNFLNEIIKNKGKPIQIFSGNKKDYYDEKKKLMNIPITNSHKNINIDIIEITEHKNNTIDDLYSISKLDNHQNTTDTINKISINTNNIRETTDTIKPDNTISSIIELTSFGKLSRIKKEQQKEFDDINLL